MTIETARRASLEFVCVFGQDGVRPLRTPRRAPQANAYCERLIGTKRRECLDFLIPLSEEHLRRLLTEWRDYYNRAGPHSSLGPGLPTTCVELPMKPDQHRHQLPAQRAVAPRGRSLVGSITITGCHASPDGPSFSRGTTRSFSSTLLRRWPGSDRVQNLHRGEDEFAGPQLPWLSARQYVIFFFADHAPCVQGLVCLRHTVVQPNPVADDFGRKSISAVARRVAFHPPSLSGSGSI